jgi:hypothetical protein
MKRDDYRSVPALFHHPVVIALPKAVSFRTPFSKPFQAFGSYVNAYQMIEHHVQQLTLTFCASGRIRNNAVTWSHL